MFIYLFFAVYFVLSVSFNYSSQSVSVYVAVCNTLIIHITMLVATDIFVYSSQRFSDRLYLSADHEHNKYASNNTKNQRVHA